MIMKELRLLTREKLLLQILDLKRVVMNQVVRYDNILNAKLQVKCEDLIEDLDGIQRNFESKLDKILKKYRDNNDNIFETELECIVSRYPVALTPK